LRYLLDAEKRRLETALRIEEERSIVFPETSVIIHDIQRLMGAIEKATPQRAKPSVLRNRNG
jgi:hypothetical protein